MLDAHNRVAQSRDNASTPDSAFSAGLCQAIIKGRARLGNNLPHAGVGPGWCVAGGEADKAPDFRANLN
jgi:hypothetical protein